MPVGNSPCMPLYCQVPADAFGNHQVGCGGNSDRTHWHNSIRDALFSASWSAALAPRMEAPSLSPSFHSHPTDFFLPNWQRGQPAALDVTVISTLQQHFHMQLAMPSMGMWAKTGR